MARSRNIKPGFFTNADLAELSPLARLLFAGLWTIADKAGRLRDRPKHIKGQVLPYDDCDVDALLNELATVEEPFINRYSTESTNYIQINNWHRHQSPHHTEQESEIPSPTDSCSISRDLCEQPLNNGAATVRARRALNQESGINKEGIRKESSNKFSIWWDRVPRKAARGAAEKAYAKAVQHLKDREDDPHAFLLERICQFAKSDKAQGQFCPHPSTWLNQECYDDDPAAWGKKQSGYTPPTDEDVKNWRPLG